MFTNRDQAGQLLAGIVLAELEEFDRKEKGMETLVIGIPHGGVLVAAEVASALRAPLGVLASCKIGAPFERDVAIGAVSSAGVFVQNDEMDFCTKDLAKFMETEKLRLEKLCRQMESSFMQAAGLKEQLELKNKRVVLVDDGAASGMTALAAIKTLRLKGACQVILAVPIIPKPTVLRLQADCDLIVSLATPHGFSHLSQYYEHFEKVSDEEVVIALRGAAHLLAKC